MISSSGHKKRGLLLFPSATPYMETYSATWMFPKNSSEITLQVQHNQQEYNRYYRRLWFMNLSRTLIFQSNSMQPHQQTMSIPQIFLPVLLNMQLLLFCRSAVRFYSASGSISITHSLRTCLTLQKRSPSAYC